MYASISTRTNNKLGEVWGLDRLLWPEIRIASLLSAGYTVHEDCGLGWALDRSRAALVQKRKFQHEADMTDYAPLMLFYRFSSNDATPSAFFVSIPAYKKSNLTCEIDVYIAGTAPFMALDYNLFSFNLARERLAEVSLGNWQAVVAKYKEGTGISFMNISIETLNGDRAAGPVSHDTAKTD